MSAAHLPGEIWDRVIDHLHEEHAALEACALVCHGWLASARLHRFRSMHIPWHGMIPGIHGGRLTLLCDPSSSAPFYVRSLYLSERASRGAHNPAGPLLNLALPRMRCREMTALRSLTMKYAHWDLVTPDARACLAQLCTSLQHLALVSPRMSSFSSVLELVCAAPVLQALALYGEPRYEGKGASMPDVGGTQGWPAGPRELHSLWLLGSKSWYPLLRWMPSFGLHAGLRHLHVQSICSVDGLTEFIRLVADTLKSLSLAFLQREDGTTFFDDESQDAEENFLTSQALAECRGLQGFSVVCRPAFIVPFLRQIASRDIAQVSINVVPGQCAALDLDALRHLFCTSLASASLVVLATEREGERVPALQAAFARDLPELHAQCRLRIVGHGPGEATSCAYYGHRGDSSWYCREVSV